MPSVGDYERQLASITGRSVEWVRKSRSSDYGRYQGADVIYMRYKDALRRKTENRR